MRLLPATRACARAIMVLVLVLGASPQVVGQDVAFEEVMAKRQELVALFEAGKFDELDQRLNSLQALYESGKLSETELGSAVTWISSWALRDVDKSELLLNTWIKEKPQSYAAHVVRGAFYIEKGSDARGTAYAKDTSQAQFRAMRRYFRRARKDFDASLSLSSKPILSHVGLQGIALMDGGREERKAILDEAIAYAPNSYLIRASYMTSLTPRWGGTYEEMAQFARESEAVLGAGEAANGLWNRIDQDRVGFMLDAENYAPANALLTQALARRDSPTLLCMRAHANVGLERLEEAVADLQASLKYTDPNDYCAGIVHWIAGFAGAEPRVAAILDGYVARNPSSADLYFTRAWWRQSRNEFRDAFDDLEVAAKIGDFTAQLYVGQYLLSGEGGIEKDPQRGLAFLRESARRGGPQSHKALKDAIEMLGLQAEEAARLETRKTALMRLRARKTTADINNDKQHWGLGRLTDHRVVATILGALIMMVWVRLDKRRI